jgi:Thiolase, C-terminal domain
MDELIIAGGVSSASTAPRERVRAGEEWADWFSWASVGVDPAETWSAPVKAIPKALARAGLTLGDVDLFEINEAFAAMCVACVRILEIDPRRSTSTSPRCAPAAAWAVPRSSKFSRPNSYSVLPAAGVMRGIRWPGPGKSRSLSSALILQPFTEHDDDADG